ncbi:apolipoprotein N-acyltransferase [Stella humosa]|uniref:Apolipoprotein N-acyltransferase n=1 Tax=Stella humosa TaxID=94 RepID=A0A3N1LKQ3_9PROT|nr:apolipoprotein N-acyltransferase [Stella humosa]ROP91006.1 apolipoprotein N-acyltransferase [Stella humosa]BBK34644.1 apolipoprotein N-acyltransferase [Stella humosa]
MTPSSAASGPARLAAGVSGVAGWRRWGLAFLLGAAGALALPPLYLLPALFVAFTGLIWQLDGAARARTAFALGWWFGFGYFTVGLYWIAAALFIDIASFWWLLPFTVTGLPALLAALTGAAALAAWATRATGLGRVLALAAAWSIAEWIRTWFLSGFPWNLIGQVWGFSDATFQAASLVGVLGLGLVAVLAAGAPAALAGSGSSRWAPLAVSAGLVAIVAVFGFVRLSGATDATVPDVRLRLVQASIPQTLKWNPAAREGILRRHIDLSQGPGFERVTHVVWPETAGPSFLDRDPQRRAPLAAAAPPAGLLLTGTNRTTPTPTDPPMVWNAMQAIDPQGAIVGSYDKAHLVPFGEYLPLRAILGRLGMGKVTAGSIDFSAGPGPRTLDLPGLPPVGPLICYEVIFPSRVVDPTRRPEWLLNLTNDGWYGRTAGPFQHLEIARARAVEEGLPLVRSANNGISAVFDAYGREQARLALDAAGVLDAALPRPIAAPFYARIGLAVPVLLALLCWGLAFVTRRRRTLHS